MTEEPLKEVPDLFKHFHPFKGTVPVAHQLNFQDAADRARVLLEGWDVKSIRQAAEIALKLHNEGNRLLIEDLRKDGLPRYSRPTKTIYRAKEERTELISLNGRPLHDSELFAALALYAISDACKAISDLRRNRLNNTADIVMENMQTATDAYIDEMVVVAQATIERAELVREAERRDNLPKKQGRIGGYKREPEIRKYQWEFIQTWESGRYEGLSISAAVEKFLREFPPQSERVKKLQDKPRTLKDALRRRKNGKFVPPLHD